MGDRMSGIYGTQYEWHLLVIEVAIMFTNFHNASVNYGICIRYINVTTLKDLHMRANMTEMYMSI